MGAACAPDAFAWQGLMRPAFAPMGGAWELIKALDRNLTVAQAHPAATARAIRLEMAARDIAALRERLDDLEAALAAAWAAAQRQSQA